MNNLNDQSFQTFEKSKDIWENIKNKTKKAAIIWLTALSFGGTMQSCNLPSSKCPMTEEKQKKENTPEYVATSEDFVNIQKKSPEEMKRITAMIELATGIPLPGIRGIKEFYGKNFNKKVIDFVDQNPNFLNLNREEQDKISYAAFSDYAKDVWMGNLGVVGIFFCSLLLLTSWTKRVFSK